MSIQSLSMLDGGTIAVTGGTATTVIAKDSPNNHRRVILDDGAVFQLQKELDFSVKEAKVSASAPNGYTQARNALYLKEPFVLDNGSTTVCSGRIEIACDVELTEAERRAILERLCIAALDSDVSDFWGKQSTE